jgi:small-conductance mechanosensitive channel
MNHAMHDQPSSPDASGHGAPAQGGTGAHATHGKPYLRLLAMIALSFLAMYVLMYAMVDRVENALPNHNQFYMAGLMAAPMLVIELLLMRGMYPRKGLNAALMLAGAAALLLFWFAIRQQAAIDDRQFLKSMVPHHAGAILMCGEARLRDPRILELCEGIVAGQQAEIAQMKQILRTLDDSAP